MLRFQIYTDTCGRGLRFGDQMISCTLLVVTSQTRCIVSLCIVLPLCAIFFNASEFRLHFSPSFSKSQDGTEVPVN